MADVSSQTRPSKDGGWDADDLGVAEGGIVKKYFYLTMALLILAAIVLVLLRFILYLW